MNRGEGHMNNDAEKAKVDSQTNRPRCYICGAWLDEYHPAEVHHIIPKGMGGSKERDVPSNKVKICSQCHNRLQPRSGTRPSLKLYRDEDGEMWVDELVDGEWKRRTPYGRMKSGAEVDNQIAAMQQFGQWLEGLHGQLDLWSDEALREQYYVPESLGTALFATQCLTVHILAERRAVVDGKTNRKSGLKSAAEFLGISYYTARLRHAVWESIFSHLNGRDTYWQMLSPQFLYEAYHARNKYAIDPIEALDYAEAKLMADRSYSPTKFRKDLAEGLPAKDGEGSVLSGCPHQCVHAKRAGPDATMRIYVDDKIVAEGSAEGQWYCEYKKKLLRELDTDMPCEAFERR